MIVDLIPLEENMFGLVRNSLFKSVHYTNDRDCDSLVLSDEIPYI